MPSKSLEEDFWWLCDFWGHRLVLWAWFESGSIGSSPSLDVVSGECRPTNPSQRIVQQSRMVRYLIHTFGDAFAHRVHRAPARTARTAPTMCTAFPLLCF